MLVTIFASIGFGQVVGFGVLIAISAVAGYAAWVMNDGRECRCPRCHARVGRFTRCCGRCRREITPEMVATRRKVKGRRVLAAEVTFFTVLAAGGLIMVSGNHSSPAPEQSATPSLPPSKHRAQPTLVAGQPWPIDNELRPVNATPQYNGWVEASKTRAIAEHPALGVPGSPFQLAFVARYRELSQEQDPRLDDPRWPEELASEVTLRLTNASKQPGHP